MKCLRRALARAAFCCLLTLALSPAALAQQAVGQFASPRPDADSIALTVTVTDRQGNYIGGLSKNDFAIYDNRASREVSFFAAQDEPVSVGVVVDFSGSVTTPGLEKLTAAGKALMRFASLSNPANDYFLVGFASRPRILIDWTDGGDFKEKLSKMRTVEREGTGTALRDACYLGVEKLRNGKHPKRVLLLISDGEDNESLRTSKELKEALRNSDVALYSVGIFGDPFSGTAGSSSRLAAILGSGSVGRGGLPSLESLKAEGQSVLNELASASGGKASFPDKKKKIETALDAVAIELRHQYLLGFKADSQGDGKWHQLKVRVTVPDSNLNVRTREGYYAAASDTPGPKTP
jgi:Ca-activated chloride channel family protein